MPELPPWLTQQADPVGAFLRGAQSGAVIAGAINQRNITQSNLRLNEQQAQMNHLKMEQAIKQRDRVIKGEFVLRSLADQIEPLLAQGKPEMAMNVLLATGAREPSLFDTEGYPELLKHTDAAIKTEETRKQLESMDELRKSQIYENKARGELALAEATDMQLGVGTGRFAPANLTKLIAARDQARNEGRMADATAYEAEINRTRTQQTQSDARIGQAAARLGISAAELSLKLREAGVVIEPGAPVQSVEGAAPAVATPPLPVLTPVARPLTSANVTRNQETLSTASIALREIATVKPLISAETVGPMAAAKGFIIDRGLANIWPDLANLDRIEASSVFSRIRASVIRALRSDSNINKDEVATLEAQVPSSEAFLASPVRAMAQIESIADGVQERAINSAKLLDQALPDDVLRSLDDVKMLKYHRDGKITEEDARRWYKVNPVQ